MKQAKKYNSVSLQYLLCDTLFELQKRESLGPQNHPRKTKLQTPVNKNHFNSSTEAKYK